MNYRKEDQDAIITFLNAMGPAIGEHWRIFLMKHFGVTCTFQKEGDGPQARYTVTYEPRKG